jgi:hypothetical protein
MVLKHLLMCWSTADFFFILLARVFPGRLPWYRSSSSSIILHHDVLCSFWPSLKKFHSTICLQDSNSDVKRVQQLQGVSYDKVNTPNI